MIEWRDSLGGSAVGAMSERIASPRLTGTPGDDVIRGNKDDNVIDVSQGGDDIVNGRGGDDTIYFGATLTSTDMIDGFRGSDTLVLQGDYSDGLELNGSFIEKIEQVVLLSGGSYVISGDFSFGGRDNYLSLDASSLTENESLQFDGANASVLTIVSAGQGDDIIHGGNHGFALVGGGGEDMLYGGFRNGTLVGGDGADQLFGGGELTGFIYVFQTDSTKRAPDTIIGFREGDEINLFSLDADTTQAGDQAFHFGSTPGHVGDLIAHYNKAQDLTIVRAFTDGDAKADMEIHLTGHVPLTPDDFVL